MTGSACDYKSTTTHRLMTTHAGLGLSGLPQLTYKPPHLFAKSDFHHNCIAT
jgi:hypothetical protein